MLILVRSFLNLFKKEHDFLVRYERTHAHFLRYLAVDALLSLAIGFAGFQIYESYSSNDDALSHSGNVVMSSTQLVNHLRNDALKTYWLGPISGDQYTVNHEIEGIVDVMYLPQGLAPIDHGGFDYEIKTYVDEKTWDSHTHPILATAHIQTIAVNPEIAIRINPASMKGVIVTFSDKPEILAIAYPTPRSLSEMIKNVEALKLVR